LIESVGLAARSHTIVGVEANSRQYFPKANDLAATVHPGLFAVRDGYARTASVCGSGLGMQIDRMPDLVESLQGTEL
jgi:hypothetical protein